MFLDNFYTSYYHNIMQGIPNDKKSKVKKIAKEMINKRNKEVEQRDKEITRKNKEKYTYEEWVKKEVF
ncbi:hypothetical protein HCBAA847_1507 [Helicobacter cinaedi CCUG 18818 = ATCC BAA-847]|nr:hypothetical protein [Helicobacter cinaedi]BAM32737.1 hypothetical protein HCBAA847_1507 [Helicobacter cinaedi CCUG 18818 = ATCC BAA-847]